MRLQDAVASRHALAGRVDDRAVQRMRHLADQPPHGVAQNPGVSIQRDDEFHALAARQNRAKSWYRWHRAAVGSTRSACRACAPTPSRRLRTDSTDAGGAAAETGRRPRTGRLRSTWQSAVRAVAIKRGVLRRGCLGGIRAVGQQRIMHRAADAGQVMHLKPFNLLHQVLRIGQQDRHRNQACADRPGMPCSSDRPGSGFGPTNRVIIRLTSAVPASNATPTPVRTRAAPCNPVSHRAAARNSTDAKTIAPRYPASPNRRSSRPNEVAGVAHSPDSRRNASRPAPISTKPGSRAAAVSPGGGHRQSGLCHRRFIVAGMACQHLDRGAIAVAGGKIHLGVARH